MKFAFIAKHRGIWPAAWLCEALGVSRAGFYAWLTRPPSARASANDELLTKVRASFLESDRTYGARRVWHDLLADGASCGLHRIERLMRQAALRARPRRRRMPVRYRCAIDECRGAECARPPVHRRLGEPQMGRRLHLSLDHRRLALRRGGRRSLLPPCRRLVDEATMTAQLVTDALVMAIWRRGKPGGLLHHSDQGSQYTSEPFQRLLADHGVTCSMSRSGNVLGQCRDGELLLLAEDRTHSAQNVPHARPGQSRRVRLHRALLQSQAAALDVRLSQSDRVRTAGGISVGGCQLNRQQPMPDSFVPIIGRRLFLLEVDYERTSNGPIVLDGER